MLDLLLASKFVGREELAAQADTALVQQIDPEGSLRFMVGGPSAPVQTRIPVEGRYLDGSDDPFGPAVNLLIHVVEGRLHELEIYKDDDSQIGTGPYSVPLGAIEVWPP